MSRNLLIRLTVVALAGTSLVLAAAGGCGGSEGPTTYTLESGVYDLNPEQYEPNTCWPEDDFPPTIEVPVRITANGDGTLTIEGEDLTEGYLPTIQGTIDGNNLSAGPEGYTLDATEQEEADADYTGAAGEGDCFLVFEASASGTLTADNEFDVTLPVDLWEETEGGCSELYGDQLDLGIPVPFPDLEDPSECNFTAEGHAVKQAEG